MPALGNPRWQLSLLLLLVLPLASARLLANEPAPLVPPLPESLEREPIVIQPPAISASQWVALLASPLHAERETASAALRHLGLDAQSSLRQGLQSTDPEVRRRCRLILADCLEADYRGRLAGFAAEVERKKFDQLGRFQLPVWDRYSRAFGTEESSVKLYLAMQQAEPGLFATADADGAALGDAIQMRFQQAYQPYYFPGVSRRKQVPFETIAAILFLSSDPNSDLPSGVASSPYWSSIVGQTTFREALQKGEYQTIARRLLGLWVVGPTSLNTLHQKLQLAIRYEVTEGVDLALAALEHEQTQPSFRGYCAMALGSLGGKPYCRKLAAMLDNDTECSRRIRAVNGKRFTDVIQLRDIALAWLIFHTDQKHADYGWDSPTKTFEQIEKGSRNSSLSFYNFGFAEEKDREQALQQWYEWAEKHELPQLPQREYKSVKFVEKTRGQVRGNQQTPADDTQLARLPNLETADRLYIRTLSRAAQAIAKGENVDASAALGEILADPHDFAFQPQRDVPLYRRLKPEAERLLSQLNDEGRAAYRLQFGSRAARELSEALRGGTIADLRAIGRRYFHTHAGADATYLAAVRLRLQGDPLTAALLFSRLKSLAWEPDRYQPALSLQLATCYQASGFRNDARRLVEEITARWGDLSQLASHMGETTPASEQAAATLSPAAISFLQQQILTLTADAQETDWKLFRGDLRRNATSSVGGAYLAGEPLAQPSAERFPAEEQVTSVIADLAEAYRKQRQTSLPTLQPLVVGERLIVRTRAALAAYDMESGHLLWSAPLDDVLRDILRKPNIDLLTGEAADKESLARGLHRRYWDDHAFGRLSSDGRQVYAVESHTLGVEAEVQRLIVRPDGRRQLDAGALRGHNTLAAYDIASGKLRWEIGQPAGDNPAPEAPADANPLAGLYFLGPPLPLNGGLHVIASREHDTLLLELEADTGELVHEMLLEKQPAVVNPYQNNVPLWMLNSPEHRCGASPAYAQGVMICRLSPNRYAAIDPASQEVLWRYDPEPQATGAVGNNFRNWQKKLIEQANRNPTDHWADATATIADGKVLLTPSDLDQMLCLRLRDGKLLWQADRHDSIYLAGVDQKRVIMVGRSSVRALDLQTGASVWQQGKVDLPPGATPSGIGYFHSHAYYLPLATGEIARLDLQAGEFTARSLSAEGLAPGNTIAASGHVITQTPLGVWIFPTLDSRQRQLDEQPESTRQRVELGETLLYQGQLQQAIDQLQAALQQEQGHRRATELLAIASLEGLRTNYEAFRHRATDLASATDDPSRRFRFLQEEALAREKAGQEVAALEAWLAAVKLNHQPQQLIYTAAARAVRRDRYLAARLESLMQSATAATRPAMQAKLQAMQQQLPPREQLRYLPWHESANAQRIALATELMAGKQDQWPRAEWLLRRVIQAGSGNDHLDSIHAQATALLAQLLTDANRHEQAARCYHYLNTELANVVCLHGQTGSELYASLPTDSPARHLTTSRELWPVGKTTRKQETTSSGFNYQYLVPTKFTTGPLAVQSYLEIDTSGRSLSGVNHFGADRWKIDLPRESKGWSYSSSLYSHSTGRQFGHLLFTWMGNRVAALDLLNRSEKPLWTLDTHVAKPPTPGMRRFMPMQLQAQRNFAPGFDSGHAPLALLEGCLCFQQERKLLAVDPLTSETLWRIDNLTEYSSLYSLGKALLVVPRNSDRAVIYAAADGREIGRRHLPEPAKHVGWSSGRLIYWRTGQAGRELVAYDPLADRETFSQVYAPGAYATLLPQGELAVLDADAGLQIWSLASGKRVMSAKCPLPADLQHMVVVPSEESYTVVTCVSGFENSPFANSQSMFGFLEAHGPAYCFERGSGRQRWQTEIDDQRIRLHQPVDLPILVFRNQQYKREGKTRRTQHAQLILDRRSGEELHRNDNAKNAHFLYQTTVDPKQGEVKVHSSREQVTLYFKQQPKEENDD